MRISDWSSDVCSSDLEPETTELQAVQVTGPRIPRAQIEGPSPISVITAEQISASGFTNMPEAMRSMTQNNGATQSPQPNRQSDFPTGSQQVDLPALCPTPHPERVNGPPLDALHHPTDDQSS